ncbi:hypothetical protein [Pseudomonas carnis]|uniref:hypothetical protein n=1 Tax=Pseudomonas carnis TaxID=2487355 RepID=UPI0015E3BA5A|nr:hypothetical protein [Pseudomonas carnis]MBA1301367.1 hypothetical protein [Pseudomonas carnis]MBJ2203945.1 hypothetical protein [Pseudomonas carnis]
MKYLIDKAAYDALEPSLQAFYKAQGEDYVLAVEGLPAPEDTAGLKAKVEELLREKKDEKTRREQAEQSARLAAEEAARKNGDTEALDRSWSEKHNAALAEKEGTLSALQAQVHALTVGATAARVAGELAVQGSAAVLQQIIEPRLSMELREGKPTVVVLDAERRPTALTVEEFKTQLFNDAALAPLIASSRASGGGAAGGKGGGAAKPWNQLTGMERVELRRTNPAEHARLKAAAEAQ